MHNQKIINCLFYNLVNGKIEITFFLLLSNVILSLSNFQPNDHFRNTWRAASAFMFGRVASEGVARNRMAKFK